MIGGKTVSLVMIVRDESHIIKQTLQNIVDHIDIDRWDITDTGSEDNTKQIIIDFFREKKIEGELYIDEWVNHAHNRTYSIKHAFGKSDYIFIFDADDYFSGDIKKYLPKILDKDAYSFVYSTGLPRLYRRSPLVENRNKIFIYESVLHEYITCKDEYTSADIPGGADGYIHGCTLGNDAAKYARDALVFERELANLKPEDEHLRSRYYFYLAQSYKDSNQVDKAIEYYLKRYEMKDTWIEERYCSLYELMRLSYIKGLEKDAIYYALLAYDLYPIRLETLGYIFEHYRFKSGTHRLPYIMFRAINPRLFDVDTTQYLFVNDGIYKWQLHYDHSICCFYNDDYNVLEIFKRIYKYRSMIPKPEFNLCISNLQIYIDKNVDKNYKKNLTNLKVLFENFSKKND